MNANFKYLIYCFIALLAFSCKEDAVDPVEDLAYFKDYVAFVKPIVDSDAVYSPDGKKIAFFRDTKLYELIDEEGLYLMNSDGSNLEFIKSGFCYGLVFSPDGNKLAYTGSNGLTIYNLNTRTYKSIPNGFAGGFLDWSPDGKQIACERFAEATNGGYVLGLIDTSLDLSTYKQITKANTGDAREPSFARDSKYIYFLKYSNEDKAMFLSIQKIDLKTLVTSIVYEDNYYSLDLKLSKNHDLMVHNILDYNIILRSLEGELIQRVPVRGNMPTFHPNGKLLLFSSPDSVGVGSRLATYNLDSKEFKFIKYY
jgi:Tol biopolymer transport system component